MHVTTDKENCEVTPAILGQGMRMSHLTSIVVKMVRIRFNMKIESIESNIPVMNLVIVRVMSIRQ